jgi:peptidoglycan/LPS O-acetylase OafA/YrhL
MHSEHLSKVHPGWVVGGWLVSIAVASAAYLALVGLGLASGVGDDAVWSLFSMAVGFFVGGLFVGFRWTEAPILHGLLFGLISMAVLLVANLLVPEAGTGFLGGSVALVLGVLLIQIAAAVGGGLVGRRAVLPMSRDLT